MPQAKDTALDRHPDAEAWNKEAKRVVAASSPLRAHANVCERCRRSAASPLLKDWCETGLPLWRSAYVCYWFNGPRALVATIEARLAEITRGPGHFSDRPAARRDLAIRSGSTLARYVYPKTPGAKGELLDTGEPRADFNEVVKVFAEGPRLAPAKAALLRAFRAAASQPADLRGGAAEELLGEVLVGILQATAPGAVTAKVTPPSKLSNVPLLDRLGIDPKEIVRGSVYLFQREGFNCLARRDGTSKILAAYVSDQVANVVRAGQAGEDGWLEDLVGPLSKPTAVTKLASRVNKKLEEIEGGSLRPSKAGGRGFFLLTLDGKLLTPDAEG